MIIKAIKTHKNLVSAASYLGISRQSLNQKINKYKIPVVKNTFDLAEESPVPARYAGLFQYTSKGVRRRRPVTLEKQEPCS